MATLRTSMRPLSVWKAAMRQAQCAKVQQRGKATRAIMQPTLQSLPDHILFPRVKHRNGLAKKTGKQEYKPIRTYPPPPTALAKCKDPVSLIEQRQIAILDPKGARALLFDKQNKEAVHVGDIVLVRQKNGEPFSGVCLNIRRQGLHTAILLRNHVTRVGVEMWFKIYSPNVTAIEVVQRAKKRARRARLYYLRQPKHDPGSVDNIVRSYLKRASGATKPGSRSGSFEGRNQKKSKKR
ncbi:translation protein SH3-like domain-containing protein [Phyllosticta citrichinensis]|uniref:Translation protein SH3-like domain-containing protein n=1 Tax=Phyllosticta citrichinensis TaxID=1130410 RepID=A0ABR1XYS8_9PEZI